MSYKTFRHIDIYFSFGTISVHQKREFVLLRLLCFSCHVMSNFLSLCKFIKLHNSKQNPQQLLSVQFFVGIVFQMILFIVIYSETKIPNNLLIVYLKLCIE